MTEIKKNILMRIITKKKFQVKICNVKDITVKRVKSKHEKNKTLKS